jgi:predicted ester cyclase
MSEEIKERVRRFFAEVVSTGAARGGELLFHEDVVWHSPLGDLRGLEQVMQVSQQFKAVMRDGRVTVEDVAVDGELIAWRITGEGTQTAAFAGIAASGRTIRWTNNDFGHLREGKVIELWGGPDAYSILEQLGALSM